MEQHIIFNRKARTILIGMPLDETLPTDEFSWKLEEALMKLLEFTHPFDTITISKMDVEDIPQNLDMILKRIDKELCFEVKMSVGRRRRRRKTTPWTKPVKKIALVLIGRWRKTSGYLFFEYVFVRFYFKRTIQSHLLS